MFVKRIAELQLLEDQYAFDGNNLVLLYGRKGTGKTTLLTEFIKNKAAVYYYEGTECEEKLQLIRMNQNMSTSSTSESILEYPVLLSNFITSHD
ncbi:MAG: ATP-binding protein, partial [Mobilitalea sp.]